MTHSSKVIFQFPKQTIIESFTTRKNILNFTSEKRKLKWPFEGLINDISSSVGSAFRSFVISVLKDKTIICSDNRPRQSSFSDSLLEQKSKNRDQSALFIISRLLYAIYMGYSVVHGLGVLTLRFVPESYLPFRTSGKQELPFQRFRCSRKFSTATNRKVVFLHLLPKRKFTITRMLCQSEQQMSAGESYSFCVLQNRPILIAEEGLKLSTLKTAANEKVLCRSCRLMLFLNNYLLTLHMIRIFPVYIR